MSKFWVWATFQMIDWIYLPSRFLRRFIGANMFDPQELACGLQAMSTVPSTLIHMLFVFVFMDKNMCGWFAILGSKILASFWNSGRCPPFFVWICLLRDVQAVKIHTQAKHLWGNGRRRTPTQFPSTACIQSIKICRTATIASNHVNPLWMPCKTTRKAMPRRWFLSPLVSYAPITHTHEVQSPDEDYWLAWCLCHCTQAGRPTKTFVLWSVVFLVFLGFLKVDPLWLKGS